MPLTPGKQGPYIVQEEINQPRGPNEQNTHIWGQKNNHVESIFFGEALHIFLCVKELKPLQPKPKAHLGVLKFPLAMQASEPQHCTFNHFTLFTVLWLTSWPSVLSS